MADTDKELMMAALRQLDGKMNFKVLAEDLGMNSAKSANQRWVRFKAKLHKGKPNASASASPIKTESSPARTPKRKGDTPRQKTSAKKRKFESSDEEDDVVATLGIKNEPDDDTLDPRTAFTTPTRRLPARSARMKSFKQESSDEGDPEEEEFADSGHGGTPAEESDAPVTQSEDEA